MIIYMVNSMPAIDNTLETSIILSVHILKL